MQQAKPIVRPLNREDCQRLASALSYKGDKQELVIAALFLVQDKPDEAKQRLAAMFEGLARKVGTNSKRSKRSDRSQQAERQLEQSKLLYRAAQLLRADTLGP